jgi:hypothetical protein
VRLPDISAYAFQHYVDWAYGDVLVSGKDIDENLTILVELYLLGDKLDDVKLRNKAIKALTSCGYADNTSPGPKLINLVWDSTTPNSPLRRWIVDENILRGSRPYFETCLTTYPAEFTQQIALKFMQQTPTVDRGIVQSKTAEYLEAED